METPTHRTTNNRRDLVRSPYEHPRPRYPSLYQDFEPYFGRNQGKSRRVSANAAIATNTAGRNPPRPHFVRLFALLAIVALIAALAAASG